MSRALVLLWLLAGCGEPLRDFLHPVVRVGTAQSHTLLLVFDQVTLHGGPDDATIGSSSLLQNQTRFTAYAASDPDRTTKIAALVDEIATILAPYDVDVTTTPPAGKPYDMLVFTDDTGDATGCSNCISLSPMSCNTGDAPVAFVFAGALGGGQVMPPHLASAQAVAIMGLFAAIPTTSLVGDCMCYADTACLTQAQSATTPCTMGGPGTPVSVPSACPATDTTIDENAAFLAAFGPAP